MEHPTAGSASLGLTGAFREPCLFEFMDGPLKPRRHPNADERKALKAAELHQFVTLYGRKHKEVSSPKTGPTIVTWNEDQAHDGNELDRSLQED